MGRLGSLFSSGALEKRNQKQSLFLVSSPVEMVVAASTGGHGGAAMGAAAKVMTPAGGDSAAIKLQPHATRAS
jgi:hypothetical protein